MNRWKNQRNRIARRIGNGRCVVGADWNYRRAVHAAMRSRMVRRAEAFIRKETL